VSDSPTDRQGDALDTTRSSGRGRLLSALLLAAVAALVLSATATAGTSSGSSSCPSGNYSPVVVTPDGNAHLLISATDVSCLVNLSPDGQVSTVALSNKFQAGNGIAATSDGTLWLGGYHVDVAGHLFGHVDITSILGAATPQSDGSLWLLASSPEGMAAGIKSPSAIDRISATGQLTAPLITLPSGSFFYGPLTTLSDGAVWAPVGTEPHGNWLYRLSLSGQILSAQPWSSVAVSGADVSDDRWGAEGNLWGSYVCTASISARVFTVSPSGQVNPMNLGISGCDIHMLGPAADGTMWFWESRSTSTSEATTPQSNTVALVGRVSSAGQVTTYTLAALPRSGMGVFPPLTTEANGDAWIVRLPSPDVLWVDRVSTGGSIIHYVIPMAARAHLLSARLQNSHVLLRVSCPPCGFVQGIGVYVRARRNSWYLAGIPRLSLSQPGIHVISVPLDYPPNARLVPVGSLLSINMQVNPFDTSKLNDVTVRVGR
jgi:hypothetical protein